MRLNLFICFVISLFTLQSCSDEDSFSVSSRHILSFSADTIKLDTVFSNVPSSTRSFWVYNRSGVGLRLQNVRLEGGNQNGFRVNVNGSDLSTTTGFRTSDIELYKNDSIRVFVELTSPINPTNNIRLLEDQLTFTLESNKQQTVLLQAYTWNALSYTNLHITTDSVLSSTQPIIIYGGIKVDSTATLTIARGTTLYFHAGAGIDVYGRLLVEGTPDAPVTLRGDRLDRMFEELPYNRVSGQWKGIRFYSSSYDNKLTYADIHSTFDGIVADSSDITRTKLTLNASSIHNCQGFGVSAANSKLTINNCVISNTLKDCVRLDGGRVSLNNCTLAQFYPFDAARGSALQLTANRFPLESFSCINTLITGYAADVLAGDKGNKSLAFDYRFDHCILRTPKVLTEDSLRYTNVVYENPADTLHTGKKHFVLIDEKTFSYDFRLSNASAAIDKADPATALPTDRNAVTRDNKPDIGAYEYKP